MGNKRISLLMQRLRIRDDEAQQVSVGGKLIREMITLFAHRMNREAQFQPNPIDFPWSVPDHFEQEVISLEFSSLEMLTPKEDADALRVVYQLHGGAYITPLTNNYRVNALRLSKLGQGCCVATLNYRTAPAHLFPSALLDAYEGYMTLLGRGYSADNIVIAGDSAGGNLALALTMMLRDEGQTVPSGLVLISPWTDLAAQGDSYRYNLYEDPMFGIDEGQDASIAGVPTLYAGEHALTDPMLSPAYGTYEGFPPMLIQVGSCEMLLSDSECVAKKATDAGAEVMLHVYEGMFHVFPICCGELIPESRAAWDEIRSFLDRCFSHPR